MWKYAILQLCKSRNLDQMTICQKSGARDPEKVSKALSYGAIFSLLSRQCAANQIKCK